MSDEGFLMTSKLFNVIGASFRDLAKIDNLEFNPEIVEFIRRVIFNITISISNSEMKKYIFDKINLIYLQFLKL